MRIAQVAPLTEAVPPKLYGGTERVVHWLTEELVALGHDVTLFASGDSQTSARLDATWPRALRLDGAVRDPNALHMVMLERVRQKCDDEEFDFLHFHLDYYPFSLFSRQPTPFLTTLHGRLDLPEHQPVFTTFSEVPVISISNAQRRPVPQANWVRTIHHGVPENLLTPQPAQQSYLAVLGRIAPEKGVDRAIKIATRCGMPLKIAAKVDRADQEYYDELISPLITGNPLVEYIGEISDREKPEFLSGAIALLTIMLLVVGFHVPMLGDASWLALVVILLIASSLGLGLLVAAVSDSEPQAVQLSLLVLLASVFFSGFVLAIDEFSEPVRSLIYALPVANGIRLIGDFMFRGGTVAVWQIWVLAGLAVGYIAAAWLLLRRVVSRA